MEHDEVFTIVDEEFDTTRNTGEALMAVRQRIARTIAEKRLRPDLPDDTWTEFLHTFDIEADILTFVSITNAKKPTVLILGVEMVEKLERMYAYFENLLGFIHDNYENLPVGLRDKNSRDKFLRAAAHMFAFREEVTEGTVRSLPFFISNYIFRGFYELLSWKRQFLLGRERLTAFVSEVNESLAILRTHPYFVAMVTKSREG